MSQRERFGYSARHSTSPDVGPARYVDESQLQVAVAHPAQPAQSVQAGGECHDRSANADDHIAVDVAPGTASVCALSVTTGVIPLTLEHP